MAIYMITDKYRREEFYQRLEDRTYTTFTLLLEVEQIDHDILQILDKHTVNKLYEEKTLIFDADGNIIYSSIDDTPIAYPERVLAQLKEGVLELELQDGEFELLGIRFEFNGKTYYGITKAYDRFGRSKLKFLEILLITTFLVVSALLIFVSRYLSGLIIQPVARLTEEIEKISPENLNDRVYQPGTNDEVGFLAANFNRLLDRVESAFKFQSHFVHHLSHELKTPLAVMMTNAERGIMEGSEVSLRNSLVFQKNAIMELSNIINAMLEISKTETSTILSENVRIDELLFECMDEISFLNSSVVFDFSVDVAIEHAESLTVTGNSRMLKMALMNLLKNAAHYSRNDKPAIEVTATGQYVVVNVLNDGPILDKEEQEKLFLHFFRGKNSAHVKGFGLGLVLAQRIVALHKGALYYVVTAQKENCFCLQLPLG